MPQFSQCKETKTHKQIISMFEFEATKMITKNGNRTITFRTKSQWTLTWWTIIMVGLLLIQDCYPTRQLLLLTVIYSKTFTPLGLLISSVGLLPFWDRYTYETATPLGLLPLEMATPWDCYPSRSFTPLGLLPLETYPSRHFQPYWTGIVSPSSIVTPPALSPRVIPSPPSEKSALRHYRICFGHYIFIIHTPLARL